MEIIKTIFEYIAVTVGGFTGLFTMILVIAKLFGRNLIDEWFARRNKQYQALIDKELAEYKSKLDSQLEVLRISYGNVFSERMAVFKEACVRMQRIEEYYRKLAAYKYFDCKDNINFEHPCTSDCPKDCIKNYSKLVIEMKTYVAETNFWFQSNEFFFAIDQYTEILKLYTEILRLLNNALAVIVDLSLSETERANKCFDIFVNFNMTKFETARNQLVDSFRYVLNIPIVSTIKINQLIQ